MGDFAAGESPIRGIIGEEGAVVGKYVFTYE